MSENKLSLAEEAELKELEKEETSNAELQKAEKKAVEVKSTKELSYKALVSFYYRVPCAGGQEKVKSFPGQIIPGKFLTKEIIGDGLVAKVK